MDDKVTIFKNLVLSGNRTALAFLPADLEVKYKSCSDDEWFRQLIDSPDEGDLHNFLLLILHSEGAFDAEC